MTEGVQIADKVFYVARASKIGERETVEIADKIFYVPPVARASKIGERETVEISMSWAAAALALLPAQLALLPALLLCCCCCCSCMQGGVLTGCLFAKQRQRAIFVQL